MVDKGRSDSREGGGAEKHCKEEPSSSVPWFPLRPFPKRGSVDGRGGGDAGERLVFLRRRERVKKG